jgi:hypothetical protein
LQLGLDERSVAVDDHIGHQIAMKSDEKKPPRVSESTAKGGNSDRRDREAAALRANLRRRKQQQQARQATATAEHGAEGKDEL